MENRVERDTARYPPLHEQLDMFPLHLFWRIEAAFAVNPATRIMTRSSHKEDGRQFGFGRCLIPFFHPGALEKAHCYFFRAWPCPVELKPISSLSRLKNVGHRGCLLFV